jgi:DNA-binding MarR family transcriptional regulator
LPEAPAELAGLVSRQFARNLAAAMLPHGVAPAQFQILQLLWAEDGLSQRALADRARIEPPTLVRTLDRMERDGQVKRRKDKHDKRQTNIFLTARGRRLQTTLRRIVAETEKQAQAGVSKTDRKTLTTALRKMAENLGG